ncbi:EF-hand domain-containing protein [Actinokineospora pegani]|uniref:EF-hand domain-containing protein n=1 Tax=Actinokineospora pegani TaxID=2654637 RepID=UPI0012EA7A46|nr:EF-hand domain-containing protein [Actinokineospora pegani]
MTASVSDSRLQRRFELWDANGDGSIDRSDYEIEARRILRSFGEHETSPKGRNLVSAYLSMWDALADMTGVGPNGSVTMDQFLDAATREVVDGGNAGFDRTLRPTIEAIVNIADTDGDGEVNPTEFQSWLRATGVDPREADKAFARIDTDGSGALTVEELVVAVRDYHQGKHDVALLGR